MKCDHCGLFMARKRNEQGLAFCDEYCERYYNIKKGKVPVASYRELNEGEEFATGDIWTMNSSPHERGSRMRTNYLETLEGRSRIYHYSRKWNNGVRVYRPTYVPMAGAL